MRRIVHHGRMSEDLTSQGAVPVRVAAPPPDRSRWSDQAALPWLRKLAIGGLSAADGLCAALRPGLVREAPGLITLALHSLCVYKSQLDDPALAPHQNVWIEDFRMLVETMLESGYTAVSPAQVDAGLAPDGRYMMITFDDGYFNNVLALDVLEEFEVPATFFIASNHVLQQKAFWWDALNREMTRARASRHARKVEVARLKALPAAQIEAYFRQHFGPAALRPHDDRDRPFTRAELRDFARHRWVHLGNHTADHAILTRCEPREMARQITSCQQALGEIAGTPPIAIAYPNGNHSAAVVEAALAAGLRIGLTVHPARNALPLRAPQRLMRLGRFYFHSGADPRHECRKYRCGFIPSHLVRSALQVL